MRDLLNIVLIGGLAIGGIYILTDPNLWKNSDSQTIVNNNITDPPVSTDTSTSCKQYCSEAGTARGNNKKDWENACDDYKKNCSGSCSKCKSFSGSSDSGNSSDGGSSSNSNDNTSKPTQGTCNVTVSLCEKANPGQKCTVVKNSNGTCKCDCKTVMKYGCNKFGSTWYYYAPSIKDGKTHTATGSTCTSAYNNYVSKYGQPRYGSAYTQAFHVNTYRYSNDKLNLPKAYRVTPVKFINDIRIAN
ncbi:MAG: hypothetical protein DA328_07980 [Nitrososphaeraceae archaeon]|nr:hypothetical protein [Nitrososphaeraceae archaeon]